MSALFIIITAVVLLLSMTMVGLVLAQKKNVSGFSLSGGSTGSSNTYWDKNKSRSVEGQLEKYTKIVAFLFFVFVFASNVIK